MLVRMIGTNAGTAPHMGRGDVTQAAAGQRPGHRGTEWQRFETMMNAKMKTAMLATGVLFAAATLAQAQGLSNCAPRERVVERLADKYGETRQSMGLGANNAVVEVFASLESGSWTITVTSPAGITCLVASGQAFEELAEALPPKGDDA